MGRADAAERRRAVRRSAPQRTERLLDVLAMADLELETRGGTAAAGPSGATGLAPATPQETLECSRCGRYELAPARIARGEGLLAGARVAVQRTALDGLVDRAHQLAVCSSARLGVLAGLDALAAGGGSRS